MGEDENNIKTIMNSCFNPLMPSEVGTKDAHLTILRTDSANVQNFTCRRK